MKMQLFLLISMMIFFSLSIIASAESPYAHIDVYFNGKLYPGAETPRPLLKIGEPFTVRFDVTPYQKCYLCVELWSIGSDDFQIIDGSSTEINEFIGELVEANETVTYGWTVAATDNWAGGSTPLNFYYQLDELGVGGKIITKGEFTAAYITVSEEYYDGKAVETPVKPATEEPAKAPGFILPIAVGMLLLAGICRRNT